MRDAVDDRGHGNGLNQGDGPAAAPGRCPDCFPEDSVPPGSSATAELAERLTALAPFEWWADLYPDLGVRRRDKSPHWLQHDPPEDHALPPLFEWSDELRQLAALAYIEERGGLEPGESLDLEWPPHGYLWTDGDWGWSEPEYCDEHPEPVADCALCAGEVVEPVVHDEARWRWAANVTVDRTDLLDDGAVDVRSVHEESWLLGETAHDPRHVEYAPPDASLERAFGLREYATRCFPAQESRAGSSARVVRPARLRRFAAFDESVGEVLFTVEALTPNSPPLAASSTNADLARYALKLGSEVTAVRALRRSIGEYYPLVELPGARVCCDVALLPVQLHKHSRPVALSVHRLSCECSQSPQAGWRGPWHSVDDLEADLPLVPADCMNGERCRQEDWVAGLER